MMHQTEFKEILGLYMRLRKEGVIFPERDPNARYMIKFDGIVSPIYQTIEDNKVYEEPSKQFGKKTKVTDFISEATTVKQMSSSDQVNAPKYVGQDLEIYNQRISELKATFGEDTVIGAEEIIMLRESCLLLDEIMTNVETLDELRGEFELDCAKYWKSDRS